MRHDIAALSANQHDKMDLQAYNSQQLLMRQPQQTSQPLLLQPIEHQQDQRRNYFSSMVHSPDTHQKQQRKAKESALKQKLKDFEAQLSEKNFAMTELNQLVATLTAQESDARAKYVNLKEKMRERESRWH